MSTKRSIVTSFVNTSNGGTLMNRIAMALFVVLSLSTVGCATDTVTDVNGTVPVEVSGGNHVANWDPNQCFSDEDCSFNQLCVIAPEASEQLGLDVYRCETACDAKFSTILNEDGTSVTSKAGDSCQRFGDKTLYCDMKATPAPVCTKYSAVAVTPVTPPVVEPPVVEPTLPQFVQVSCCFNAANLTDNMFAQLAWSTSDAANPEAFGKDGDLSLDSHGCFLSSNKIELSKLHLGFWVELTNGKAATGQWLGSGSNNEYAPVTCEVDDEAVTVGAHMDQCGYGIADATNLSCQE